VLDQMLQQGDAFPLFFDLKQQRHYDAREQAVRCTS
jgi:hypothetical protein